MIINYASDFHLEHHISKQYTLYDFVDTLITNTSQIGHVLILAGDFSHMNDLSVAFIKYFSKYYERTFVVTGNHDRYLIGSEYLKYNGNSMQRVKDFETRVNAIPNVFILKENEVHTYNGVSFAGQTMMTAPMTETERYFYNKHLNDSKYIMYPESKSVYTEHDEQFNFYFDTPAVDVYVSHYPLNKHHIPNSDYEQHYREMLETEHLHHKHYIYGHVHAQHEIELDEGIQLLTQAIGYEHEHFDISLGILKV